MKASCCIHSTILIPGLGSLAALAPRLAAFRRLRCDGLRSAGKKIYARLSDGARVRVFSPDLARPDAPGTPQGRSGAQFSRPKRQFLRRLSLWVCTLPHDLPTLTKHCVGARISSFGLVAIVPTSGENSLRTLLGEGFALATRSTRAWKHPKRANSALEIADLAPRTANKAAKTANLAAKTAQLGVARPFQTRPSASPSHPRAPKPAKIEISSIFRRFFVDFRSSFRRISLIAYGLRTVSSASSLLG